MYGKLHEWNVQMQWLLIIFPQNMANIAKFIQSEDFNKLNNVVWKIFWHFQQIVLEIIEKLKHLSFNQVMLNLTKG